MNIFDRLLMLLIAVLVVIAITGINEILKILGYGKQKKPPIEKEDDQCHGKKDHRPKTK